MADTIRNLINKKLLEKKGTIIFKDKCYPCVENKRNGWIKGVQKI